MVLNENKNPNDTIDAVEYNEIASIINDITTNGLEDELTVKGLQLYENGAATAITGLKTGGELSINAGDGTLFDISDGSGYIVDHFTDPENPVIIEYNWTGLTGITPSYSVDGVAYIGIQDDGFGNPEVIQYSATATALQRRTIIHLGAVVTQDAVNVDSTTSGAVLATGGDYLANDMSQALGSINISGNTFSGATGLQIQKAAGQTFEASSNLYNDAKNPNITTNPSLNPVTFIYVYDDGAGGPTLVPGQNAIVPGSYDDKSGTLASVGNNNFTNQHIWYFPEVDITVIQYGQNVYSTMDEAVAAVNTETFSRLGIELQDDALRCTLSMKGNATDLTNITQAVFTNTGKFGFGGPGGSGGVEGNQDLQSVYNLSSNPEIITDAVRGGINFQGGTGTDTDNVIEVNNNAGTLTADIQADGAASFLSITGDGTGVTNVDAITLNGLSDTAFVKADGTISMTGDFTISSAAPTINLTETGGSVAWKLDVDADELAFGTAAGDTLTLTEKELKIDNVAVFATEFNNGNTSVDSNLDWNDGNFQKATLNQANTIFIFTNPSAIGRFQIKLVQDVTGSRTATWPASVKWPGGTAPTLSTAAGAIDIITFYFDGTDYYGVESLNFQ